MGTDSRYLKWCISQKRGIQLVDPNDSISRRYIAESWSDYEMIDKVNQKWKTVTAYYSCYNAIYAILVKIGIKCEIHDCTIGLMGVLGFSSKDINFLSTLKKERVDIQYYLKPSSIRVDKNQVLEFLNVTNALLKEMNDAEVEQIRAKMKELMLKTKGK